MESDTENIHRNIYVAEMIKSGKCPFGALEEGQTMSQCPSGFPGCACGDEYMLNSFLQTWLMGDPEDAHSEG